MNGSHASEAREALEALVEAGTLWAATGHGQPLVDAAVVALTAGLDSPSLRVLAGAPKRFADEEASGLAPDVSAELALSWRSSSRRPPMSLSPVCGPDSSSMER